MTPPATGETPAGGALRIHDKDVAFAPVRVETDELLAAAEAGCTAVTVLAQRVRELAGPPDESLEDNLGLLVRCEPLLAGVADDVRRITADPDDRWVTWCETGPGPGPRGIGATPLFAGELLRDLWYGADLAPVATSATLSVAGDFTHLIGELGLDRRRPSVMTRRIASPFDYARQARFFAPQPETFPDPDQAGYADAVADVLRELVTTLPRRALALFTSYRLLDEVAARLESGLPFAGVPEYDRVELIAQQSRGGAEELMRRLRRRRRALLLGTATFWEGVDLPGEQLELLVVTKLPFRVPSDPWVEARCAWLQAQGENPFTSFILRDAVVRLLQGVGRLVRSSEDRGVVVFLDTRLHAREYGITFLDALPGTCALFRDARDLAARAGTFFSAG
jgi:ATP-dependent DNA helicase DinG